MATAPNFQPVESDRFPELARLFERHAERRINLIHLHHTFIPDQALFNDLTNEFGDETAAGLELCRRMWRYHTADLGWSDIGQHVTIDPAGRIWLNRSWNRPPASASGFNGSGKLGPFMIEMIGNFDKGQETPTKPQEKAMLTVMAAMQSVFGLGPDAFAFHNEMTNRKTCPGNSMDKAALIAKLVKQHASLKGSKWSASIDGPLDVQQTTAHRLLTALLSQHSNVVPAGGERGIVQSEIAAEPEEDGMSPEAIAKLTGRAGPVSRIETRAMATRGGGSAEFQLTPAMRRELKPHVINLRQGEFSNDGDFTTSSDDADALVNRHLDRWVQDRLQANETPRVMVHAHGGLTSEESGLVYAYTMYKWWKQQGVYPIFFVWETGTIETIWQLLEEKFGIGARGLTDFLGEARDAAIEFAVRQLGQDFWSIMKLSAERASDTGPNFGAHQMARLLHALHEKHSEKIEFHTVGHSAGAIFHAYFMREFSEGSRQIPIQTVHYLAPACTIDLFKDVVLPRVKNSRIQNFNLYTMDRMTERDDPTVPAYGKSLLYLVSRGFERRHGEPILGLEESIVQDPEIVDFLGLGGTTSPNARLILSPSGTEVPDNSRAGATTHGGFDNDQDTMTSVALRVVGGNDASTVPPVPAASSLTRGGSQRLFAPLTSRFQPDVYRQLFGAAPPMIAPSVVTMPVNPSPTPADDLHVAAGSTGGGSASARQNGKRIGLCIGIDDYPGDMALNGCVNDANLWADLLRSLNFDVTMLVNSEATHQGMIDAMTQVIARAQPGDLVAIQYAGHGTFFGDTNSDEEDQLDEALVPFHPDSVDLFLSDDELWPILQGGAAGAVITVFMDCCHSASNTRAAPPRSGSGKARKFRPTSRQTAGHLSRMREIRARSGLMSKAIADMKHVKFAACQDNEVAFEDNGHGKFTLAATNAIQELIGHSPVPTNDTMRLKIEKAFQVDRSQTPHLEARTEDKLAPFLGGVLG